MEARKPRQVEPIVPILDDQHKRRVLVELILDPPKVTKKVETRSTDTATNDQLVGWIGSKLTPCIDGMLWEAMQEDIAFRSFGKPLLGTSFGQYFLSMFMTSGKGRVPIQIRDHEALSIAGNFFVSELAALFLAFKGGCKDSSANRCVESCRATVGLISSENSVIIPAEVQATMKVNESNEYPGKQKGNTFFSRHGRRVHPGYYPQAQRQPFHKFHNRGMKRNNPEDKSGILGSDKGKNKSNSYPRKINM